MAKQVWSLRAVALLSATLAVSAAGAAKASEVSPSANTTVDALNQVQAYGQSDTASMAQVTSVSQLSDVKPTDWAFQALQSLVERYGCIAGYPDKTYRGNRAMTRYEFAAGLNACMDRVNELIAASNADLVKKEDLETLRKLQEEFAAELATLRGRVDALEAKTATLEKQQFSTTTKLAGEAIFSLAGALGGNKAVADNAPAGTTTAGHINDNTTFSDRVRLRLNTSFTGQDLLQVRLQARNVPNLKTATGTNMARLSYGDLGSESPNSVAVDKLFYKFPLGDYANVTVDAIGGEFYSNVDVFNPDLASDAQGAISRFGRFNPIYRYGAGGSGATVNYGLGKQLKLSLGYLAEEAADPTSGRGLLNGSYGAIAQLSFKPSNRLGVALTYVRGYERSAKVNVSGGTGGALANAPFGSVPTASNNFGLETNFRVSQAINLSGWAGLTRAYNSSPGNSKTATLLNWAIAASFPDLGGKGNMAGIIFGQPPKVLYNGAGKSSEDSDTSYHLEALYRYRLNDKVSITPGFLVIFNPEHNNANDTVYVGTVRTTFTF